MGSWYCDYVKNPYLVVIHTEMITVEMIYLRFTLE